MTVALASVTVDNAAAVHLSNGGLQRVVDGFAGVLQSGIEVGPTTTSFQCDPADLVPLTLAFDGLDMYLTTDRVTAAVEEGAIHLHLDLGLIIEAPDVSLTGDCLGLLSDIDQSCDLTLGTDAPVDFVLDVRLGLELTDDGRFDATVIGFGYSIGLIPNPFSDCVLADIFDLLPMLSDPPNDHFFSDLAAQYLDPALVGLGPTLETAVEDGLAIFPIEVPVDLLGKTLNISIDPSSLELDDDGLLIGLALTMEAPWDPACVDGAVDGSGVVGPPAPPPLIVGGWPQADGTAWALGTTPYDASLLLNKDAVDQALFQVWQAGLLCLDVSSLSPIALGTSLLGALHGDTFRTLFPDDQPAVLTIGAESPPAARFTSSLLALELDGLSLSVATALDQRLTRVATTLMDADATLDAALDGGNLALALTLDPTSWSFSEADNEILPLGYSAAMADGLPGLISSFLPADLLPSVILPTFQGIGVGGLVIDPSPDGQWQGLFLTLDTSHPEPLVIEGCEGGCDQGGELDLGAALGCDEGCEGCSGDGGCESSCEGGSCDVRGRGVGRVGLLLGTLLAVWRRRSAR